MTSTDTTYAERILENLRSGPATGEDLDRLDPGAAQPVADFSRFDSDDQGDPVDYHQRGVKRGAHRVELDALRRQGWVIKVSSGSIHLEGRSQLPLRGVGESAGEVPAEGTAQEQILAFARAAGPTGEPLDALWRLDVYAEDLLAARPAFSEMGYDVRTWRTALGTMIGLVATPELPLIAS